MKKIMTFIIFSSFIISAYSQVKNYEFEFTSSYQQSFSMEPRVTFGLVSIIFKDNKMFSYNTSNNTMVYYNNDFSLKKIEQVSKEIYIPQVSKKILQSENIIFFQGDYISSSIVKFKNNSPVESIEFEIGSYSCVYMQDNFIILESEEGYKSIIIPNDFKEDLVHMNQDDTFTHIKENWTGKDQFWIDKDRYILFGKRLITGNGDVYQNYFNFESDINAPLISVDKYNNYYWGNTNSIFIFNKKGSLIKSIRTDAKYEMSYPFIDPSGNVYYFHYNEETYNTDLYRIKNDWSTNTPDPYEAVNKTGTVTEFRVRIRDNPSLYGKHIGLLTKNDKVEILSRTLEKMAIDDMNDYWYRIKKPDGTEGWTYGYFIKIEE